MIIPTESPIIETQRLVLRPWTIDDAPAIAAYMNDKDIGRYVGNKIPYPYTEKDAVSFLEDTKAKVTKGENISWTITHSNEVIGGVDIHDFDQDAKSCLFGYLLARKTWGQGLMTEAIQAILEYAFATVGVNRVGLQIYHPNEASMRVARKCGFQKEGVLREKRVDREGNRYDEVIYGILKKDWEELLL